MAKCPFCGNEVETGKAVGVYQIPDIEEDKEKFRKGIPMYPRVNGKYIPLAMFECDKCENIFFKKPGNHKIIFGELGKE